MWCEIWLVQMGAEYKVHTKLLTEFETLGVMGENCSGIIKMPNNFWHVVCGNIICESFISILMEDNIVCDRM